MKKEFIPYEQALQLKELGFDEPCFGLYAPPSKTVFLHHYGLLRAKEQVLAPLYQQAFRWFREKYGLYSWVTMELGNKSTFCWVLSGEHTSTQYAAYFHTYEEAELACLIKLIEIVQVLPDNYENQS
jgi:hypothetical protein